MESIIEKNNIYNIESSNDCKNHRKLLLINNEGLIEITYHINFTKINLLQKKLEEQLSTTRISIKEHQVLTSDDHNYSYNDGLINYQVIIMNKTTKTIKEKINLLQTKKENVTYGDIKYIYSYRPDIIKLIQELFKYKYTNFIELYNYLISLKNMSVRERKSAKILSDEIHFIKYKDVIFNPNDKEKDLNDDEINLILKKIFDCIMIDSVEKTNIVDNKISIDVNDSIEDLIRLKGKLTLAKINSEILESKIFNNNEIVKTLKIER